MAAVLAAPFAAQLLPGELPCPALPAATHRVRDAGGRPILNVRHGPRPSHYALSLLAAAAGAAFATRQILLHILPRRVPAASRRSRSGWRPRSWH